MAEELKVKIMGEIPEGAERSSVRARFAPDAAEDVKGHFKYTLAPTEGDDAEGQGVRLPPKREKDREDDAEGHTYKWLKPVEGEDAEGQTSRFAGFKPVDDEDADGNALKSHVLEIDRDENGELIGRYVSAGDDTEGQGFRAG
jgi:hypothetical protein